MAPPTKFAVAEAERGTLKLNLNTLEQLLTTHVTTPLDEATVISSLELAKTTQQQLIDNQRGLATYAPNATAFEPYELEYPTELLRAIRLSSGFTGITMSFPPRRQATAAPSILASTAADIRLPRLQIPMFSGNLEHWLSFRDLFEKAIGNNATLSKAQKLTYLKSYLEREAARHVRTLVISDPNFDVAESTLTNRYQNDRQLLFSILNRLLIQTTEQKPTAEGLRNLIDTTQGCIRSLEVISIPVQHWDTIIVYILFQKLDLTSRQQWEHSLPDSTVPTLKSLTDFLEQRARALAAGSTSESTRSSQRGKSVTTHHAQPNQKPTNCPACDQSHPIFRCQRFREMSVSQRLDIIKKASLCYNCLGYGHGIKSCQNKHSCKTCGQRHHTLVHRGEEQSATSSQSKGQTTSGPTVTSHVVNGQLGIELGVLATARVRVLNSNGRPVITRVLLDGGSPVSFITRSLAKTLHLSLEDSSIQIDGIGGASAGMSPAITSVVVKPYFESSSSFTIRALVLEQITNRIPNEKLNNTKWSHLDDLRLADPDYAHPGRVDLLIGGDLFLSIVHFGVDKINGPKGAPYAIRSSLGWLVAGSSFRKTTDVSSFAVQLNLEETVQKFWKSESVPDVPVQTKEERECEDHFKATHARMNCGRFMVRIPWKTPKPPLGSSKAQALQRLMQLERRLIGNHVRDAAKLRQLQQHREDYVQFMQEYQDLGHMSLVPQHELDQPAVYISHHFVLKELSTTTRFSYLAIFVCFSTRAIHIEVVESLSTESFLAALRRFTSRRGKPSDIFSDCGTNFVGANRAIKEIVQLCKSSTHNIKVANSCSTDGIQWHFNPTNSPHFGGLWEAGVRSVKYHLNRVMGSSRYTYVELLTLVNQVEPLLNSRPLCPASDDPADCKSGVCTPIPKYLVTTLFIMVFHLYFLSKTLSFMYK